MRWTYLVDVRVHECDVIVARHNVAERRQLLLDALDTNGVRQSVFQVLQLLISRRRRDEQTIPVVPGCGVFVCLGVFMSVRV
jgi:hypothetical protein